MAKPSWPAIALLSGAALSYEVLLTRLLALLYWHHFAYMIISLALLGYGVSGTFLALAGERLHRRFDAVFATFATLFGLTAAAGFLLAQRLPFNPLELAWDAHQLLVLPLLYLLLALPFFFAACAVGLALWHFGAQIPRIYAADLLGAGVGAVAVVGLLVVLSPLAALFAVAALGPLAAVWTLARTHRTTALLLTTAALGVALLPAVVTLAPSPYKDLSQALEVLGAEPILSRHGPLGVVDVVSSPQVPFRYAPGLSLTATQPPPEQLALYLDGDQLGVVSHDDETPASRAWLDELPTALPYHLAPRAQVLVLGAGGGMEVLQALSLGAESVDAVELNPQVAKLMGKELAAFSGGLYRNPRVHLRLAEARSFVARSADRWDLIQVALLDAYSIGSAGLHALNESHLYTVEALGDFLDHLAPGGVLAFTRWLRQPPRDTLKLLATAREALVHAGAAEPEKQLLLLRGWNTATLLVGQRPFTPEELANFRQFARDRAFDPAWAPDLDASEVNRFHRVREPLLHEGAVALLGPQRAEFLAHYKFDLTPASDDRPYFFHFFRWQVLPELLALPAGAGRAQVEWGYLVLVATLGQALVASLLLILLPLAFRHRSAPPPAHSLRWRVFVYFTALGLGFLFLEIAFIQRFVLFLGHPLYALTVALAAFLLFAGLGSAWSQRVTRRPLLPFALLICGIALGYLLLLPLLLPALLSLPTAARIAVSVALIAPLAFLMGIPFPVGLARLSGTAPELVPWAWAVNGCASVVSAVLATLLAMACGFSGVVVGAVACYVVSGFAFMGMASE